MNEPGRKPASLLAVQALVAFLLMNFAQAPLLQLVWRLGWFDPEVPQQNREAVAASFIGCCLLVIGFALLTPRPLPFRPAAVGRVLAVYFPFILLWGLFVFGYLRAMHWLGLTVPVQPLLYYWPDGDPGRPAFWMVAAMMVVVGPLAEEIVFRGYLHGVLEAVFGVRVAWVVTALAFGILHGWPYALPIGVLGLLFGWLRLRHRSLLAPFVAHAVHNGAIVLLTSTVPGFLDWLYPR